MKRLFNFMAMAGLLVALVAGTAKADGLYAYGEGGVTMSIENTGLSDLGPLDGDVGLGTGYNVGVGGGYEWADVGGGRLRATLGFDHMGGLNGDSDWSATHRGYTAILHQRGDITSYGGRLGVDYDVMQVAYQGNGFAIYPTVRAGLRVQNNRLEGAGYSGSISDGEDSLSATCESNANNTAFGWDVGGGVGVDIGKNVSVLALYSYTDRGDVETPDSLDCTATYKGKSERGALKVDSQDIDLRSHEVIGRLSYRFSL